MADFNWNDHPVVQDQAAPQAFNWGAHPEVADSQPGQLEAFARGAGSGLTLGAEPAIAGAGSGALAALSPGASWDDIVKAYKTERDSEKGANDKASAAHPITSMAGNLVGGLPLALLTDGATELGAAGGAAKAAQSGAILGAGAGVGNAVSEGKGLADTAKDAITGAGTGMLTGAALHGAMGVGKELANTEAAQNFAKAFKYGTQGTDLVTKAGGKAAQEGISDASQALGMGLRDANKSAGQTLGNVRQALSDSGATVNTTPTVDGIKKAISNLQNSENPNAAGDAQFLQKYLDNLVLGKKTPVTFNEINPEEVIPGTPSAQDKLLAQKAKLEAQENLLPKGATSDIQQSTDDSGNPFLNLVKQVPGEDAASPKVGIKTTLPDAPGTPDQVIPGGLGPDQTQTVRMGGIDPNATPFTKANDIKQALTEFAGNAGNNSPLKTNMATNSLSGLGKDLNNSITGAPIGEGPATQLASATNDSKLSYGALKSLGLDDSDFSRNPITGEMELNQDADQSLKNKLRQLGRGPDTQAGQNSSDRINNALEQLQQIDPEAAARLGPQVQQAAEQNALYQKGQGNLLTKSGLLSTAPVQVGNRLGNTGVAQGISKAASFAGDTVANAVKGVSNSDLVQGAKSMMATGSPTAYKLASQVADAASKTGTARNAALFSLLQQPGYRDLVKTHIPGLATQSDSNQSEQSNQPGVPGDQQGQ